jgi:hypothetical protein
MTRQNEPLRSMRFSANASFLNVSAVIRKHFCQSLSMTRNPAHCACPFGQASLTCSGGYPIPSRNTRREGTAACLKRAKTPVTGDASQLWFVLL